MAIDIPCINCICIPICKPSAKKIKAESNDCLIPIDCGLLKKCELLKDSIIKVAVPKDSKRNIQVSVNIEKLKYVLNYLIMI